MYIVHALGTATQKVWRKKIFIKKKTWQNNFIQISGPHYSIFPGGKSENNVQDAESVGPTPQFFLNAVKGTFTKLFFAAQTPKQYFKFFL